MNPTDLETPPVDDPLPPGHGCGWFESTHELRQGVEVQELASPDQLARQLPLDAWLAWAVSSGSPLH